MLINGVVRARERERHKQDTHTPSGRSIPVVLATDLVMHKEALIRGIIIAEV